MKLNIFLFSILILIVFLLSSCFQNSIVICDDEICGLGEEETCPQDCLESFIDYEESEEEVEEAPQTAPTELPPPLPTISSEISVVFTAATEVANTMERTRLVPGSVVVDSITLSDAEYLSLATETLRMLLDQNIVLINPSSFVGTITPPTNRYPSANLLSPENEARYTNPLTMVEYDQLLLQIEGEMAGGTMPEILTITSGGEIRYPEIIYFVSSLLRHQAFFNNLPSSQSLHVISPKGLVPWEVPLGYEEYTSVLGKKGASSETYRYYSRNAHYYNIFKQAMEIIETETDPGNAGESLYQWSKQDAWIQVGYFQFSSHPFWGPLSSSSDWIKYRRGTSGTPRKTMKALMRAVNLPISWGAEGIYLEEFSSSLEEDGPIITQGPGWFNAEIHATYGSDPIDNSFVYYINRDVNSPEYGAFPPEPMYMPQTSDAFITEVNSMMTFASSNIPSSTTRAIFINPGDVQEYGAPFIVNKVVTGGFNTIILTVKTLRGNTYFTNGNNFIFDALTPLLAEANSEGIDVHIAFSTLADYTTAEQNTNWRQESVDPTGFSAGDISPCVTDYRNILSNELTIVLTNYDVDGVVLTGLGFVDSDKGNNPECVSYASATDWKEELITEYGGELVDTIQSNCPSCDVKILSSPIKYPFHTSYFTNNWDNTGNQDLLAMSTIGNGIILPYVENGWLTAPNYHFPDQVDFFDQETGVKPGLSFYLTDEWEFPSEFYNGLMHYVGDEDVEFITFHNVNSLDGEYGPAFTKAQYQKIAEMS
jgi:hypothetical protein